MAAGITDRLWSLEDIIARTDADAPARKRAAPIGSGHKSLEIGMAFETELEMVQRHVRQGERHVLRQREIIVELALRNQPTELAETLLANFEDCLLAHQDHLSRLILI